MVALFLRLEITSNRQPKAQSLNVILSCWSMNSRRQKVGMSLNFLPLDSLENKLHHIKVERCYLHCTHKTTHLFGFSYLETCVFVCVYMGMCVCVLLLIRQEKILCGDRLQITFLNNK